MTQGTGQEGWPVGKVGMKYAWPSQESFHQYTLSTRWRVMWAPGAPAMVKLCAHSPGTVW